MHQTHGPLNLWTIPFCLVSLVALAGCGGSGTESQSTRPTPPSETASANSESDTRTKLVGSAKCAECHQEQHESYLRTTHSRSLSLVDPDTEPRDGRFRHGASGRTCEVYREDGQLRHRESLLTTDGESIAGSDYPVTYLIGSGRHTRSYLCEIDGFLVESPITWYESRQEWNVSPGYDVPFPRGFERAADMGCLDCHVGSAEELEHSLHRVRFHELAIGCERCHGPGGEHVAAAEADRPPEEVLASITHPGQLSRELREDICAQCHLRGDATVFLPGKRPADFRPGAPLTSVRVDFVVESPNNLMEVVGHVEQMHLSRCYTRSAELTCTTCHEMHADGPGSSTAEFYRSRCLDCHAVDGCGVDFEDERRTSVQDNCLTCHMPRSETDIPHIAFTHHRIGIHSAATGTEASNSQPPRLVPYQDVSTLDPVVLERSRGLAYLELASAQPTDRLFAHCYDEAARLLQTARQSGAADGDLEAALAQLSLHADPLRAERHAAAALADDSLHAKSRANALLVRALAAKQLGDRGTAVDAFNELQTVRRFAADSFMLGNVLLTSDPYRALEEFRNAADIQPFRPDVAAALADLLARLGHADAAEQQRRAALLQQHYVETNRGDDTR